MARGKLLTEADRTAIRVGVAAGQQATEIAEALGRSCGTIRNEAVKMGLRFVRRAKPQPKTSPPPAPPRPKRGPPRTPEEAQAILAEMMVDEALAVGDRIAAGRALLDSRRRDGGDAADEAAERIAAAMKQIREDALEEAASGREPLVAA